MRAATIINAYSRGFLTRRLMKTVCVQEHIRNIGETLRFVLSLDNHEINGSPLQNVLLKAKLFRQLQGDLYKFNEIFTQYSTEERLKIISSDRELHLKNATEDNNKNLSLSFTDLV